MTDYQVPNVWIEYDGDSWFNIPWNVKWGNRPRSKRYCIRYFAFRKARILRKNYERTSNFNQPKLKAVA